jgi:drug/metabolite transporter (DMT)-like permease
MVGVVLLTGLYRTTPGAFSLWGVLAGLLSGISYSVFIFAFKSAGSHGRTPVSLTVAFLAAVLALLFLIDPAQAVSVPLSPDAPLFLLFGLIGAGLSFLCYFIGLRGVLPTMAAVVAMIEPVTATLYGVIGLGQALSLAEVLGMIIILSSVTALTVISHRESVR